MSQSNIGDDRWQEIKHIWRENQWLYIVVGIVIGLVLSAFWSIDTRYFIESLVPEAFGIFFTVLVIDRLAERRAERLAEERSKEELFRNLINELKNPDNGIATNAIYLLRRYGWLTDGSLKAVHLYRANLENAWLSEANLAACNFKKVSLKGAYLRDANLFEAAGLTDDKLSQLSSLRGAVLPDGSRYDGRYNLRNDLKEMAKKGIDPVDSDAAAAFYGVSVDLYLAGQEWARTQAQNRQVLPDSLQDVQS